MKFQNARELPDGEKDEQDLAVLFITLGFDVIIHENLTAEEMVQKAEFYGRKEHKGVFFLVVLSHGNLVDNKDVIIGTDCKPVTIHQLKCYFHATNCHSLHGIPKIFIIDACRGGKREEAYNPQPTGGIDARISSVHLNNLASATPGTDSAHFMIIYASTHGNAAFTERNRGSKLTQTFVAVTNEADYDTPFAKIIQKTKAKIQETNPCQTVESVDTLTRDYLLKR